ncbi:hypothetical protein EVAR_16914_1 [Eumeta japonica]|uniref:Uncharacterized protein n=1 Tax=Eumeta variegata TaxID=151549 RepID=A0A4C1TVB1_EUMVA|nr:hypothetical protein EVAR_16914_1 [Eumeta japonica]
MSRSAPARVSRTAPAPRRPRRARSARAFIGRVHFFKALFTRVRLRYIFMGLRGILDYFATSKVPEPVGPLAGPYLYIEAGPGAAPPLPLPPGRCASYRVHLQRNLTRESSFI